MSQSGWQAGTLTLTLVLAGLAAAVGSSGHSAQRPTPQAPQPS